MGPSPGSELGPIVKQSGSSRDASIHTGAAPDTIDAVPCQAGLSVNESAYGYAGVHKKVLNKSTRATILVASLRQYLTDSIGAKSIK
jgi:hypothetical protein